LFFFTLKRFGAALTGVFLYLYPAFVILFSRVFHGRLISTQKIGALALALIGSLLTSGIAGGGSEGRGTPLQDPVGLCAGVLTGAWYALYILAGDRLVRDRDPVWTSAGVVAGSALVFSGLVGLELFTGNARFGTLDGRAWVAVAGLALFSTVLPFSTLYAGMKKVGAVRASLLSTLELAFTVALAFLFSGEKLTFWQSSGAALVLISVVLASARGGESNENGASC
jgi:drug/metabolite transporter (DMT)-like permease